MAVLAVFNEVNANKRLYYLIFGESLLNDGVAFVLFEGSKELLGVTPEEVTLESYLCIAFSFFTAPLGGMLIGYTVGVFAAITSGWTMNTTGNLTMILGAVISYTMPKMFGFSSVISLIVYGLTQERYTFDNMKISQQINSNFIVSTVANIAETILFLFIGYAVVKLHPIFLLHWPFCLIVLLAILVARMVVTVPLVLLANLFRTTPISLKWELIIFLGGLRGAVAYEIVDKLSDDYKYEQMFKMTTIFIIIITTLVKGTLTKPLVVLFDLKEDVEEQELPDQYIEEYASLQKTCFFRAWYWWEDKVILPLLSVSHHLDNDVVVRDVDVVMEGCYGSSECRTLPPTLRQC